jgi:hypothetical protein
VFEEILQQREFFAVNHVGSPNFTSWRSSRSEQAVRGSSSTRRADRAAARTRAVSSFAEGPTRSAGAEFESADAVGLVALAVSIMMGIPAVARSSAPGNLQPVLGSIKSSTTRSVSSPDVAQDGSACLEVTIAVPPAQVVDRWFLRYPGYFDDQTARHGTILQLPQGLGFPRAGPPASTAKMSPLRRGRGAEKRSASAPAKAADGPAARSATMQMLTTRRARRRHRHLHE